MIYINATSELVGSKWRERKRATTIENANQSRRLPLYASHFAALRSGVSGRATSQIVLTAFTLIIVLAAGAFNSELLHWFVIPVCLCGILIGTEAVEWLRGRVDLFDPGALLSLMGYHFFFAAPLLMIAFDWRMNYLPDQPADYRNWVGGMACLNILGILAYQATRSLVNARAAKRTLTRRTVPVVLEFRPTFFWITLSLFLLASVCCQGYILVAFGGIRGYIDSYTAALSGSDVFQGSTLLFAVGESLPILCAIGFAVWARKRQPGLLMICGAILLLMALDFFVCGLRGSRSNVIWSMFWIVGIIHFYVRRLPRTSAYCGVLALYLFVSVYAAYKAHGSHLLQSISSSGDYSAVNEGSEGPATVLVGDFSRTDVQSYLLYKQWNGLAPRPAFGATYLGALSMLIPKSQWASRPPTVLKWISDAESGAGAYESGAMLSTRVYGLAGEAMLNFGVVGVILAHAVFGLLVGKIQAFFRRIRPEDGRRLLLPFVLNICFVLLLNDSDNSFYFLIKYGLLPVSLIFMSTGNRLAPVNASWKLSRGGGFQGFHSRFRLLGSHRPWEF